MLIYRLSRRKYSKELSGKGAAIQGARWNSIGTEIIYTTENRSLAMAEVAVHLNYSMIPKDFMMLTIEIPYQPISVSLDGQKLPSGWNLFPPNRASQKIGDQFIQEADALACFVPSVVVFGERNVLINPHHPDFSKVKILGQKAFIFDRRLFKN